MVLRQILRKENDMTKFSIEKTLHEIIRDLPSAERVERGYHIGILTFDEALMMIADAYRKERSKAK